MPDTRPCSNHGKNKTRNGTEGESSQSESRCCRPTFASAVTVPWLPTVARAPDREQGAQGLSTPSAACHSLGRSPIITALLECDLTPAGEPPQDHNVGLHPCVQGSRGAVAAVGNPMRDASLRPARKTSMVTLAVADGEDPGSSHIHATTRAAPTGRRRGRWASSCEFPGK